MTLSFTIMTNNPKYIRVWRLTPDWVNKVKLYKSWCWEDCIYSWLEERQRPWPRPPLLLPLPLSLPRPMKWEQNFDYIKLKEKSHYELHLFSVVFVHKTTCNINHQRLHLTCLKCSGERTICRNETYKNKFYKIFVIDMMLQNSHTYL